MPLRRCTYCTYLIKISFPSSACRVTYAVLLLGGETGELRRAVEENSVSSAGCGSRDGAATRRETVVFVASNFPILSSPFR